MTPQQQTIAFAPAPLDPLPKPSRKRGTSGWRVLYDLILDQFQTRYEHQSMGQTFTADLMVDALNGEHGRSDVSKRMGELAEGDTPWLVVVGKQGLVNVYALAPGMAERLKETR